MTRSVKNNKAGRVLRMMDNIKKNKENKKRGGVEYNHSLTQGLYDKTKEEFDIDIPPWEMENHGYHSGEKPVARKKRIVGEGKGVHKWGKGIIEETVGGQTNAQGVYKKDPFLSNNQKKKGNK